ncbi:MAG: hypothetical protein U1F25_05430 [Rubrivivax sp.]
MLVYVNGEFVPRAEARVSSSTAASCSATGSGEGQRLAGGQPISLEAHLDRPLEGARLIDLDIGLTREGLRQALAETLARNGMHGAVRRRAHPRLKVTRGVKRTPNWWTRAS